MQRIEVAAPGMCRPTAHYVDAVRFGDIAYLSGIGPTNASAELVGPEDITVQARQVMHNLQLVLTAVGSSLDDILRLTIYLTDIADRPAFDAVRREILGDTRPAATLVEVSAFALEGMKIEVEAIAGCRTPC